VIKRKIDIICNLFTEKNLAQSEDYGFPESLDHEGLKKMCFDQSKNYCTQILGLDKDKCEETFSGKVMYVHIKLGIQL